MKGPTGVRVRLLYQHFLLFSSSRLIGFTFDALWSRVFKHPKWKRFRSKSNRRIVPLTSTLRGKKRLRIGQAADFSELNRRRDITVLLSWILPFTRKGTSSTPSVFPTSTTCWETDLLMEHWCIVTDRHKARNRWIFIHFYRLKIFVIRCSEFKRSA